GFDASLTRDLDLPGPVDRERFLALELAEGGLTGARGMVMATGERAPRARRRGAAQRRVAA
ncbi:MAG: GNAT family N-acetyltransferase, partial [Beijerinckiaceae bacterium]|nr:GNAT family N-acetyltransferase [Beijerinckiaceae bacterium]